jgi:hypothetical protein
MEAMTMAEKLDAIPPYEILRAEFLEHGNVEPHAMLLSQPPDDALLYKIMKAGDFIRSIEHSYLHFQRVDRYKDFPAADARDGEQLPLDRAINESIAFASAIDYSAANYYDSCRARTYANSFSLENSPMIWARYGTGDPTGKVCLVFNFGKLRAVLNETIGTTPSRSALLVGGIQCRQIFMINYGKIKYVDVFATRATEQRLPNPIIYSYIKDAKEFGGEREMRITLSTLGIGDFALADGRKIGFPESAQIEFDFRTAMQDGTICQLICPNADLSRHLADNLAQFRIQIEMATRTAD